jgi:hypothetical protein
MSNLLPKSVQLKIDSPLYTMELPVVQVISDEIDPEMPVLSMSQPFSQGYAERSSYSREVFGGLKVFEFMQVWGIE